MNDLSETANPPGERSLAPALAALSHPVRLKILHHLCRNETCCCKEVVEQFDLAQSTISQHLKILVDAGLVRFKPERPRSCLRSKGTATVAPKLSVDLESLDLAKV